MQWHRVTVLQKWHMAVTAVDTVHIANSEHVHSDSEDWNGMQ